jgi:hypothetical protein
MANWDIKHYKVLLLVSEIVRHYVGAIDLQETLILDVLVAVKYHNRIVSKTEVYIAVLVYLSNSVRNALQM